MNKLVNELLEEARRLEEAAKLMRRAAAELERSYNQGFIDGTNAGSARR